MIDVINIEDDLELMKKICFLQIRNLADCKIKIELFA